MRYVDLLLAAASQNNAIAVYTELVPLMMSSKPVRNM